MLKEMFERVQSELRDAIVIIIFSLNPCSFVLKEMFGQVQSELRYAIVISISYNCLYVQKEMFGFRVSSEMHAMRRRRQKGCRTAQETNNYQEKRQRSKSCKEISKKSNSNVRLSGRSGKHQL